MVQATMIYRAPFGLKIRLLSENDQNCFKKHLYGTGGTGITSDKAGIFKLNLEKIIKEFSK